MSRSSDPPPSSNDQEFEQTLADVERSLQALKDRYAQVKTAQQRQEELQERFSQVQRQMRRDRSNPLQAELKRIKTQLEELELALESKLFSWRGLIHPFWQAVRFGGLGVVIGWALKSCAG
jgi:peptidoglycan hydrolase CwlO-like protein